MIFRPLQNHKNIVFDWEVSQKSNFEVTLINFSVVVDFLCIGGRKLIKNLSQIHSKSIKNRVAKGIFKYRRLEIEKRVPRTVRHRWAQERGKHLEAKIGPKSTKNRSKFNQKSKKKGVQHRLLKKLSSKALRDRFLMIFRLLQNHKNIDFAG